MRLNSKFNRLFNIIPIEVKINSPETILAMRNTIISDANQVHTTDIITPFIPVFIPNRAKEINPKKRTERTN